MSLSFVRCGEHASVALAAGDSAANKVGTRYIFKTKNAEARTTLTTSKRIEWHGALKEMNPLVKEKTDAQATLAEECNATAVLKTIAEEMDQLMGDANLVAERTRVKSPRG
ncbi:hypothetical protein TRVL_05641 [Trypanosoma vivax]|nr:hypothetical protein TRVL_05641 [Trypanosoma vivax]